MKPVQPDIYRCDHMLGEKPYWMNQDQYEASGGQCRCILKYQHEGPHECTHGVEGVNV